MTAGSHRDRTDRAGGLDYYRNRAADRHENSYLRKRHGYLDNVAGEMMHDIVTKKIQKRAKDFVNE